MFFPMFCGLNVYAPLTLFLTPKAMVLGSGGYVDHVTAGGSLINGISTFTEQTPLSNAFSSTIDMVVRFVLYFTLFRLYIILTDF